MHTTIIISAFVAMILAPCVAALRIAFGGDVSFRERRKQRREERRLAQQAAEAAARIDFAGDPHAATLSQMQKRADRLVNVAEELVRKDTAAVAVDPNLHAAEALAGAAGELEMPVEVIEGDALRAEEALVGEALAHIAPDPKIERLVAEHHAAQDQSGRQSIGVSPPELPTPAAEPEARVALVPVVRPRLRLRKPTQQKEAMQELTPRNPAIPLQAVQAARRMRHNRTAHITSTEVISRIDHFESSEDTLEAVGDARLLGSSHPMAPASAMGSLAPLTPQASFTPANAPAAMQGATPGMAEQFAQQLAQQQAMMQQMQAQTLLTQQLLTHQVLAQQLQQAQTQSQQLQEQLQAQIAAMETIQAQLVAAAARSALPAQARMVTHPEPAEAYDDTADLLDDLPSTFPAPHRKRRSA